MKKSLSFISLLSLVGLTINAQAAPGDNIPAAATASAVSQEIQAPATVLPTKLKKAPFTMCQLLLRSLTQNLWLVL